MTTNDLNIFSAAFSCDPNQYDPPIPKSNPYYWRGREDFNHQASPPQSAIDSGDFRLTADGDDEDSASFPPSFSDVDGGFPGLVPNGNQLASVPSSDDEINLEGTPLTSPSELTNAAYTFRTGPLSINDDMFDDDEIGPGDDISASAGGGTPMNLFSVDDSESSTSPGDTSLALNDAGTYSFPK